MDKERRGFAAMSPAKQREIASKGGRAAHRKGTAHEWTVDEAREAGKKGGIASRGGRGRAAAHSHQFNQWNVMTRNWECICGEAQPAEVHHGAQE